jgi:Na+-transporting NADH:ubiquinone oxidoreductase subunit B
MNVALIARAFLFFAYPSQMSGDLVWVYDLAGNTPVDGYSGATPLAYAAQNASSEIASFKDMFLGLIPGSIGETSTLAVLIGAAILIFTGIGSWKIMLSTVAGAMFMGLVCNLLAVNEYMAIPAYTHLVMGGFIFGAVFMATDPVTASSTEKGKWIYGFMIGILVILIRVFNPAYPEGMMLAILLMNVWAPLIDYFVVESHVKRRLKRAKIKANA